MSRDLTRCGGTPGSSLHMHAVNMHSWQVSVACSVRITGAPGSKASLNFQIFHPFPGCGTGRHPRWPVPGRRSPPPQLLSAWRRRCSRLGHDFWVSKGAELICQEKGKICAHVCG
eukprot:361200-Chlamydomonas_euryale.AAC.24